jgi:hypothetical protein
VVVVGMLDTVRAVVEVAETTGWHSEEKEPSSSSSALPALLPVHY